MATDFAEYANLRMLWAPPGVITTLRQSGTYSFPDAYSIEARWRAGYATAVHEGARLRNGTILPARQWTDAVNGTVQVPGIPAYPLGDVLQQRISLAVARS